MMSINPSSYLCKSQTLLNLRNSQRWVQALRTHPRAVQNSVATVQTHAVVQSLLPLLLALISAVGKPAVRLKENGGAEVFLAVPPIRWAGGRATGAENAFVEPVELLAFGDRLTVFAALWQALEVDQRKASAGEAYIWWGSIPL